MIFAAGLGSRLAPLTDNKPKALVEFQGRTMLENVAAKLVKAGCNRLIINVHHFAPVMKRFIESHDFGAEVFISDETDFLLDTGGGILKAQKLLEKEEDTLLYNVDIFSDLDINGILKYHVENQNLATLAVKDRESTRKLVFDSQMRLCAWKNFTNGEKKISREYSDDDVKELAFSGISVINKSIFSKITETGKFSITNLYLRLASSEKVCGYLHGGIWADLGTVEKLKAAEKLTKTCT